jgi:hypothetical protein
MPWTPILPPRNENYFRQYRFNGCCLTAVPQCHLGLLGCVFAPRPFPTSPLAVTTQYQAYKYEK